MSGKNLKVSFLRENHKSKVVLQEVGHQGDYFFIEDQLKDKDNQFN